MRHTSICSIAMAAALLLLCGCTHEAADWKKATAADSTDSYQQFLKDNPGSSHAADANARIKALMDDHDWQAATSTDTRESYAAFIAQHPDSKWTQEARIRIENFAQAGGTEPPAAAPVGPVAPSPTGKPAGTTPATRAPVLANASPPKSSGNAASHAGDLGLHGQHGQMVQLGAFRSRERAQSQWKALSARFPSELKSLKPNYQQIQLKNGLVYRLRVPVASVAAAKGLCGTLKKHAQTCVLVTAPT